MRSWPFPADGPLERSRRIAAGYRAALYEFSPEAAENLDRHFASFGESWVAPVESSDEEDLVTAAEAEQHLGIPAHRVRTWTTRGHLERAASSPSRYRVGDIRAVAAAMRTRRRR